MNVQMSKYADMQMKDSYIIETFKVTTPCYTAYIRTFAHLHICTSTHLHIYISAHLHILISAHLAPATAFLFHQAIAQ